MQLVSRELELGFVRWIFYYLPSEPNVKSFEVHPEQTILISYFINHVNYVREFFLQRMQIANSTLV